MVYCMCNRDILQGFYVPILRSYSIYHCSLVFVSR
jgi:hypothetical protein